MFRKIIGQHVLEKPSKYTQYKIINLGMGGDTDSVERTFNKMAFEGWEVVEWQRQLTALLAK